MPYGSQLTNLVDPIDADVSINRRPYCILETSTLDMVNPFRMAVENTPYAQFDSVELNIAAVENSMVMPAPGTFIMFTDSREAYELERSNCDEERTMPFIWTLDAYSLAPEGQFSNLPDSAVTVPLFMRMA